MSKVVFVMNEPRNCEECILGTVMNDYHVKCGSTRKGFYAGSKPEWCPLVPLPKKQELTFIEHGQDLITMGWNACIEKIEGK